MKTSYRQRATGSVFHSNIIYLWGCISGMFTLMYKTWKDPVAHLDLSHNMMLPFFIKHRLYEHVYGKNLCLETLLQWFVLMWTSGHLIFEYLPLKSLKWLLVNAAGSTAVHSEHVIADDYRALNRGGFLDVQWQLLEKYLTVNFQIFWKTTKLS